MRNATALWRSGNINRVFRIAWQNGSDEVVTNGIAFKMISDRVTYITDQIERADIDDGIYARVNGNVYGPYRDMVQLGIKSVIAFNHSLDGETHIDIINDSGDIIKDASYQEERRAVEEEMNNIVNMLYDLWESEITFSYTNNQYIKQLRLTITESNGIAANLLYSSREQFIALETIRTRRPYFSIYNVKESKWETRLYNGHYRVEADCVMLYTYNDEKLDAFDDRIKQLMSVILAPLELESIIFTQ